MEDEKVSLIKKLRDETGWGFAYCKESLENNEYNYEDARNFITDKICPTCGNRLSKFPEVLVVTDKFSHTYTCLNCKEKFEI